MVHALEKVHRLLKPGGLLVDIHPVADTASIEVHVDGHVTQAGLVKESADITDYKRADEALTWVVERGLFTLAKAETFVCMSYADTVPELRTLIPNWASTKQGKVTLRRAKKLLSAPGKAKAAVLRETVSIARLVSI